MQLEITKTIITIELSTSVEHVTAFAHRLGGLLENSEVKGDRTILTFSFDEYSKATGFQSNLCSVNGFKSSYITRG